MESNQSKMDALNSQMNTLVESQAHEIKELKERQMIMGAVADEHINDMNGIHKEYGDMVRKLKEENEKLTEFTNNLTGSPNSAEEIIKYIKDINEVALDSVNVKLLTENKAVKEMNERLDKKVGELTKDNEGQGWDRLRLHKEIDELKQEIDELNETLKERDEEIGDIEKNVFTGYDEDIAKLKEENETLKLEIRYLNSGYGVCGMVGHQTHVGGDFQED
jgi:uncharacterized coiled-coil DUF342 family protein